MAYGEFDLIAGIRKRAGTHPAVPLGIGDDAAIVTVTGERCLVAADLLLEGRHFLVPPATAAQVGRKALAVNLSDIAAMAGQPTAAFISVAHCQEYGPAFAEELHAGLADLAAEYGVAVAGGDTTVWSGPVVINVTLLGLPRNGRSVLRSGARPGDRLFVTGPLGGSLSSGRHLTFTPRVREAAALHAAVDLHAMIDISDGIAADLGHIAAESGVDIELWAERLPVQPDLQAEHDSRTALEHALTDGEDFELAFCVSEADALQLRRDPPPEVTLYEVGTVTARTEKEPAVRVIDAAGNPFALNSSGWVHRWPGES